MHNCGSISLLSADFKENSIQPLYKFKKPYFENLNIEIPIIFDESESAFFIEAKECDDTLLINNKSIEKTKVKLYNGDLITYKNNKFRIELYDLEEKLSFNSFWHENLYLGNLPVFSSRAFEKLMEIEIHKAKRYRYPFSIILLRFADPILNKDKDIEKIICENIRFTDMLSKISDYEYLLYLLQVKQDNILKIIEKIKRLLYEILEINIEFASGIEFKEEFNSFSQIVVELYR
ncbi:MAG: hypothetical protein ACK4YF_02115 [Exilispira sp.]